MFPVLMALAIEEVCVYSRRGMISFYLNSNNTPSGIFPDDESRHSNEFFDEIIGYFKKSLVTV